MKATLVLLSCVVMVAVLLSSSTEAFAPVNTDLDHLMRFSDMELLMQSMGGSNPTCKESDCQTLGQGCQGDLISFTVPPSPPCTKDCCALGLTCKAGKCANNNFGAKCNASDDCFVVSSTGAVCLNGTCQAVMLPNDKCISSAQCLSGLPCQGGICQGAALGQTCGHTLECAYGLYCNHSSRLCAPQVPDGGDCFVNSDCVYQSHCIQGTCTPAMRKRLGENCTSAYHFWEQDCQVGLTCSFENQTCIDPQVKFARPCKTNATCGQFDCVCNDYVGEYQCATDFMPALCVAYMTSVHTCIEEFQCRNSWGHFTSGSCTRDNCLNNITRALECMCPTMDKIVSECIYLPIPGHSSCASYLPDDDDDDGLSGGQVAGIVIGVLFGVIVIIGALFYVRSKRAYDEI